MPLPRHGWATLQDGVCIAAPGHDWDGRLSQQNLDRPRRPAGRRATTASGPAELHGVRIPVGGRRVEEGRSTSPGPSRKCRVSCSPGWVVPCQRPLTGPLRYSVWLRHHPAKPHRRCRGDVMILTSAQSVCVANGGKPSLARAARHRHSRRRARPDPATSNNLQVGSGHLVFGSVSKRERRLAKPSGRPRPRDHPTLLHNVR